MARRHLLPLAVALLTLTAGPGLAQDPPVVSEVGPDDPDANRAGDAAEVQVVYGDADGDGRLDVANPEETVYMDLRRPQRVSFGDVRLTPFLSYTSGTAVNFTNRDVDLATKGIRGWFARDAGGDWYLDANADGTVNAGELRLRLGEGVERVRPGDADEGASVQRVQSDVTPVDRMLYVDEGPPGLDWADRLYLDLDTNDQVNPGELRFQAHRLGIDDQPTGREFQDAIERLEAEDDRLRTELVQNDEEMESRVDALERQLEEERARLSQARADLETRDDWLLALGLADLVAVAGVAFWVYRKEGGA